MTKNKLLIINCHHESYRYIPMGSFGICDYLSKRGIEAKILNLAIYKKEDRFSKLEYYFDAFKPTHAGLIFHWKELCDEFIITGRYIKDKFENVQLLTGGFTSSYFGEDILNEMDFLDFVVKGDPEVPLHLLLNDHPAPSIPNLIYRDADRIMSSELSFIASGKELSEISFSKLDFLYDHEVYVQEVNQLLGFPIFIGRGCVFNCDYCGGRRDAFRQHSGRNIPVVRTVESIMGDLSHLLKYTNKIYICYENSIGFIKRIFREVINQDGLRKKFFLHYGAWRLPDEEFLRLYDDAFITNKAYRCKIEISPEIHDENDRAAIKGKGLLYSNDDLKKCLSMINGFFGDKMLIMLFYSRYHKTQNTYEALKEELKNIIRLNKYLLKERLDNVRISYDSLSTDPGSYYWDDFIEAPKKFGTFVRLKQEFEATEYLRSNICLYLHGNLHKSEVQRFESLALIYKYLSKEFPLLIRLFNEEDFVDFFERLIEEHYLEDFSPLANLSKHAFFRNVEDNLLKNGAALNNSKFIYEIVKRIRDA